MNDTAQAELLNKHYRKLFGQPASSIVLMRPHASERKIFRLSSANQSAIGVINPSREENDAFVTFARFFRKHSLPVPEIYTYSAAECLYLEQDLGDLTLFDHLLAQREASKELFPSSSENYYRECLEHLTRFQIESAKHFDFSLCYPEPDLLPGTFAGDCASFATDLVARITPQLDTTLLTRDFAKLITFLEQARSGFFVYRDFQSRNIMLLNGVPYFIDFQGGRRGSLHYDVVSLLYQASTNIPSDARSRLLEHYRAPAAKLTPFAAGDFYQHLSGFVIARMLQVLGVYGRQGLGAGKSYFTKSIPAALKTLYAELARPDLTIQLPALKDCVAALNDSVERSF